MLFFELSTNDVGLNQNDGIDSGRRIKVESGSCGIDSIGGPEQFDAKHCYYCPSLNEDYSPRFAWPFDFLLLKLEEPVGEDLPLVRLNSRQDELGSEKTVRAVGWGTDGSLKELDDRTMSAESCKQIFHPQDVYIERASHMCVKPSRDEKPCHGELGSPLIIRGDRERGIPDIQIGSETVWPGCKAGEPSVVSRISGGYDWLKWQICRHSNYPPKDLCDTESNGYWEARTQCKKVCRKIIKLNYCRRLYLNKGYCEDACQTDGGWDQNVHNCVEEANSCESIAKCLDSPNISKQYGMYPDANTLWIGGPEFLIEEYIGSNEYEEFIADYEATISGLGR